VITAARAVAVVAVAALLQVAAFEGGDLGGAAPDLLLVTVLLVAWHRGAVAGVWAGFAGGLLVDTVTLERLGVTSLLLLLAGYWAGRYGETTGRGRAYAPYLTVLVLAVAYGIAGYALSALLGDPVAAGRVFGPLFPAALLDVVLAAVIGRVIHRALGRSPASAPPTEVEVVG
jgi:rod shape-determining protein MreD